MIFKNRHILRTALLAISLCLIVSAVGMTQDKTDSVDENSGNRNVPGLENSDSVETGGRIANDTLDLNAFGGNFSLAGGDERLIEGRNIMISWSKNNDELRGLSQKTGEWTNLKIQRQKKLEPIVGSTIAIVPVGDSVAAYSGITETWDVFKPAEPVKSQKVPNPVVGQDLAAVRVGNTMAAYSGITGKWDVLKLSQDSDAVVTLSNNHAQTTDNDFLYTFAAAKGKWTSPNDPKFRWSDGVFENYGGGSPVPGVFPPVFQSVEHPYYNNSKPYDAEAAKLARKYRGKGLDNKEARQVLTEAVGNAFTQRISQQKAEAQRLAAKLKIIQQAIEKRETLRNKIIQRRVDELLDPNVEWNPTSRSGAAPSPGASPSPFSSNPY